MQKSFNIKEYYRKKQEEFLNDDNLRWFIEKRNETIKENPFKLEKEVEVYAYLPDFCGKIIDSRLGIDNDIPLRTLKQVIKTYLTKYNKNSDIFLVFIYYLKKMGVQ